MFFRRLIARIRIALILILVLVPIILTSAVLYLNNQGLNTEIREAISQQLSARGMHIEFDSLSYKVTSGLVAKNVTVYSDETKQTTIAVLPHTTLNLDKTKLLRGIKKINDVTILDGQIAIPIDPEDPYGTKLELEKINGKIEFPDSTTIITNSLTATYEGIEINFTGNLWQGKQIQQEQKADDAAQKAAAYQKFLDKLNEWYWPEGSPPKIDIFAEGDINAPQHIKLEFDGVAQDISHNDFSMEDLSISGLLSHSLLTVDTFSFKNTNQLTPRNASLSGNLDLASLTGRFSVMSDLHIKETIFRLFGKKILEDTHFTKSYIKADGKFSLSSEPQVQAPTGLAPPLLKDKKPPNQLDAIKTSGFSLRGEIALDDIRHNSVQFDTITSDFSYNSGDVYLDKLIVKNTEGSLKARLLIKDQQIQYKAESSLPLHYYTPFFKNLEKTKDIIQKISLAPESAFYFQSSGSINTHNFSDIQAKGSLKLSHTTFDKVNKLKNLSTQFSWENQQLKTETQIDELQINDSKFNDLDTTLTWKDNFISADIQLGALTHGTTLLQGVSASVKNHKDIISIENLIIEDKNIKIAAINTNIKKLDGALQGNITIKDADINGFTFEQIDTKLLNNEEGVAGKINVTKPVFNGETLDHVKALFVYTDHLSLDQLDIKHKTGTLTGSATYDKQGLVHFDLISNVDPFLFFPYIPNPETREFLKNFQFNEGAICTLFAKGYTNTKNLKDWHTVGKAKVTKFAFNKTPIKEMTGSYEIDQKQLTINKGKFIFDYSNYSLNHSAKESAKEGVLNVEKVFVDNTALTVTLDNITGQAYPAPVARMFHKDSADHLEEYKFFDPPIIRAAGVFDIVERPVNERKLNFKCNLSCPSSTVMYRCLEGNLLLNDLKANVHVLQDSVKVEKITTKLFKGDVKGEVNVALNDGGVPSYNGHFIFLTTDFKDIGITYNFDEIPQGELTGNVHFTGVGTDLRQFDATGNISLDKGNLFSAPVLGPISLILNPLLPKKTKLNERLKNMSANFTIQKGIIRSDNIQSLTPSMTFTGAGWVDLDSETVDITIRFNYRGLIGKTMELGAEIIRLPANVLRGLFLNKKHEVAGLLQVRGKGHYKDPSWTVVQFDVDRGFKGKLFNPPKAVIVP